MESPLKQRLIGAAVLAALAIIFLPMLLKRPDVKAPDAAEVPLSMPASPDQKFETRELPLAGPDTNTPPGGVLGMETAPPSPSSVATPALTEAGTDTATLPTPDKPTATAPAATPASTPIPMKPETAAVATPKPAPAPTPPPASKPTVAPTTPASAAVAGGNYAVNIGSFSNLDNANALVAKLRAAKLPVTADKVEVGGKTAMRVRVGPYADRAAAEAARLRAESVGGGSTQVVTLDAAASKPMDAPAAKPVAATVPATSVAAPKPAATVKPVEKLPPNTAVGFAVQLAAPSNEADANALRDRARAQGFSAFVQRVDTDAGARFRVRVGPVADRSAAEALLESVKQKMAATGIVVANP